MSIEIPPAAQVLIPLKFNEAAGLPRVLWVGERGFARHNKRPGKEQNP